MVSFSNEAIYEIVLDKEITTYRAPVRSNDSGEAASKKKDVLPYDAKLTVLGVDENDPYWLYVKDVSGETHYINTSSEGTCSIVGKADNIEKSKLAISELENDPRFAKYFGYVEDEKISSTMSAEGNSYEDLAGDVILTGTTSPQEIDLMYATQTSNAMIVAISAYGSPPQWTKYADPRIMSVTREKVKLTYTVGRRYAETVIAQPTILSLCPGIIEFNANIVSQDTDFDSVSELIRGATESAVGDLKNQLQNISGSLVRFTPTWDKASFAVMSGGASANVTGYMAFVNTLSKVFVTYLGRNYKIKNMLTGDTDAAGSDLGPLSERNVPKLNCTYSNLDWDEIDGKVDNSLWAFTKGASSDNLNYPYVNFYVSGQISSDESFDTTVRSSTLEDSINGGIDATLKDIAFITGRAIGNELVEEDISNLISDQGSYGGILGNLFKDGMEFLRGGKVVLPQIVDDCTYGKTCQFTCKFVSPSGDVESIFWNVFAPYFHLLPFILPQQIGSSLDMYSYPFMCRAACKGLFNCPMGVLRGFRVNRGGSDNELWTNEGLPTEIEVQFEITPLYTKLMLSENHTFGGPAKFIKNTGLQEYIGTLTGVDMRLGELDLRINTALALVKGWFNDIPDSLINGILHKTHVYNIIHSINEAAFLFGM